MMSKTAHLARLLGGRLSDDAAVVASRPGSQLQCARRIPVAAISADPNQPRKVFDAEELAALAGSLLAHGQRQPITVRLNAEANGYIVISGERRHRAAMRAGLEFLDCVVDEGNIPADRMLELQVVENALRADLSAVEQGAAFKQLMVAWGCSQQEVAARLHVSPSKVSRALAALALPESVQTAVAAGEVGGMAAVVKARRKATTKKRKPAGSTVRINTSAGVVAVTLKPGKSVIDALAEAVDVERRRSAA